MGHCQVCVTRRLTRRACQYVEAQAKRAEVERKERQYAQEQLVKSRLAALEHERDTLRQIIADLVSERKGAPAKEWPSAAALIPRDLPPTRPRGNFAKMEAAAKA
jgi:hypothetical protein